MMKRAVGAARRPFLVAISALLALAALQLPAMADTYYPQTGFTVWGPFEAYWSAHGGLAQFGLPRTSVFPGGVGYDAQWFERALLTYNPQNPDAYKVELQLLGAVATVGRRDEAPFKPATPVAGAQFFQATQHNLSGTFLKYWRDNGGLPIYGYPISEPFNEQSKSDGKVYQVQYFERNRFEYHPELAGTRFEVQLGLLGSELLDKAGGPQSVAVLGKPAFYPPPTSSVPIPPGGIVESPNGGNGSGGQSSVPVAPALPPTSASVLFSDDFSSGQLSAWHQVPAFGAAGSKLPSWDANGGMLSQSGSAGEEGSDDQAILVTSRADLDNFTLDTYFYATSGEPVGAVVRYSSAGYYQISLSSQNGAGQPKVVLNRFTPNGGARIASSSAWGGYKSGAWTRLTIVASGSNLSVALDGQQVLSVSDPVLVRGAAGLYAYADGSAHFDNVRITSP